MITNGHVSFNILSRNLEDFFKSAPWELPLNFHLVEKSHLQNAKALDMIGKINMNLLQRLEGYTVIKDSATLCRYNAYEMTKLSKNYLNKTSKFGNEYGEMFFWYLSGAHHRNEEKNTAESPINEMICSQCQAREKKKKRMFFRLSQQKFMPFVTRWRVLLVEK